MTDPNQRANLLAEAQRLFFERGYESSTMTDIATAAGVSKGAVYHYFDSKQAVLEAVVTNMQVNIQQLIQPIVNHPSHTAIEKFNLVFTTINNWGLDNMEKTWTTLSALYRPENVRLQHQFNLQNVELIAPEFAAIIEQGVENGVFDIVRNKATISAAAEIILSILIATDQAFVLNVLDTDRPENSVEIIKDKFKMARIAIERILGVPANSLNVYIDSDIERWLA